MQTHLPITRLQHEPSVLNVQLIAAAECHGDAVLFIHGFNGSAVQTWMDFEKLLPDSEKCRHHDFLFFGYDGLRSDLTASAGIFRDFLTRLFESPSAVLQDAIPAAAKRPDNFAYKSLLIVGHSLGAVLARRALLDATLMHSSWPNHCRLCLFAPAHQGAVVVALVVGATAIWPILSPFTALVRFQSPLIDQLSKGSDILKQLQDETIEATKGGANPHLIASRVLIAQYERVVDNKRFANDPPAITLVSTSHIDICKPNSDYLDPLMHIESCL